jgi:hypothetical protein
LASLALAEAFKTIDSGYLSLGSFKARGYIMHYSKWLLVLGLWSILMIGCGQTQTDTDQRRAAETGKTKTRDDSKAIESYWTKEKMEKAKPTPTPKQIIDPNAPETSPPDAQPDRKGMPGDEPEER